MDESPVSRSISPNNADTATEFDRRAYPRRPCRYQALGRSAGRAWWPVVFIDLSLSGAGVMLATPIEVGAAVVFTVHMPAGRVLQIPAKVRRIEMRDGEWFAGCEFDRLLAEADFAELI
jgi:hypothetical protein